MTRNKLNPKRDKKIDISFEWLLIIYMYQIEACGFCLRELSIPFCEDLTLLKKLGHISLRIRLKTNGLADEVC